MTWLMPWALGIGAAAVGVLAALHLIARARPRTEPLPTARFVPDRQHRATARTIAPSDPVPFVVRAAALVLLAAGFAGPLFKPDAGRVVRVIAVDVSRAVADPRIARDSALALWRADAGDRVVVFDSAARAVAPGKLDSLSGSGARASLSTALAAAITVGAAASRGADSVEIVIVTPLVREAVDAATASIRASWPGRVRIARVRAAEQPAPATVAVRAPVDDPVNVAAALAGMRAPAEQATVRVVRGVATPADSAWARTRGHVLVHWPERSADAVGWATRPQLDTTGGVAFEGGVLSAPLRREWDLQGSATARWADGTPAAVEHPLNDGCVRRVGIPVEPASDMALRPAFRRLLRVMTGPCGGAADFDPVPAETARAIFGPEDARLAAASLLGVAYDWSPYRRWLLAAALLLLLLEPIVRRARRGASA